MDLKFMEDESNPLRAELARRQIKELVSFTGGDGILLRVQMISGYSFTSMEYWSASQKDLMIFSMISIDYTIGHAGYSGTTDIS